MAPTTITIDSDSEGPESTSGTKLEIQDDPEEDPRNEDNITFKVLGSAIVTIAGATIECQNNAEINIIRKKGIRPSTPESSEYDEADNDRSTRRRDRSPPSSLISARLRSPSTPPPFTARQSLAQLQQQHDTLESPPVVMGVVADEDRKGRELIDVQEDESRPSSSLGHRQEAKQPRNEMSPGPEQRGETVISNNTIDQLDVQEQDFDDGTSEIVEEREPSIQPLVQVSKEFIDALAEDKLPSSSSRLPLRGPVRPTSPTTTITIGSHQSVSYSDDSNESSEGPRSLHSDKSSLSSFSSWQRVYSDEIEPSDSNESSEGPRSLHSDKSSLSSDSSWQRIYSDEIEPSDSASRPEVERTRTGKRSPGFYRSHQRIAPNLPPITPCPSLGSSVAPQVTRTPPMNIPDNIDLNNAQRTSDSDSTFTCTIGMMSAGGNLHFSTRNYPLDGANTLHSSVSRTYEAIHGPLMM